MIAKLKALLASLNGRKSYLGVIAGGILGLLWSYGLVSDDHTKLYATLITVWTGVSFSHAIHKATPARTKNQEPGTEN
jgi:hypothetical protein